RHGRHHRADRGDDQGDAAGPARHRRPGRNGVLLPRRDHGVRRGDGCEGEVPAVIYVLMALGGLAQIWAWRLVAVRYLSIWTGSVPALVACGLAALITNRLALSPSVSVPVSLLGGLAAGVALFVATRWFLVLATASPTRR